ncbi:MAG TPA: zinc ABC transporter substrate-binding protein [Gammaproteobacteria bacterium]
MKHQGFARAALLVGASAVWSPGTAAESDELLVLTALPITYSLTAALAEGTSIEVENVPEDGRPMNALVNLLTQRPERYEALFARADAVVTIGKLWLDDPLYTAARNANIRVVEIDATKPWSATLEGVSVISEPAQQGPWAAADTAPRAPSVYYWLSPANAARSADIIARDLMRLAPGDAVRIEENLKKLRGELVDLKREYELELAALDDVTVFTLAPEFVYLLADMGLYVDGAFFKQDIDWTDGDLEAVEAYLRTHAIRVAIHKWEPEARIADAIRAAGAELVVLDPIEIGVEEDGRLAEDGYQELLRRNLDALHAALAGAQRGE